VESAAITQAKKAVSQYVKKHPETLYPQVGLVKANNEQKKSEENHTIDKVNVELDIGETADLQSIIGFETGEKVEENDEKYLLSVSTQGTTT
jgi:2-phospho-L-lactate guanylyltransferase (CobY/MobA/RfbA family)